MNLTKLLTTLLASIAFSSVCAQRIENVRFAQEGTMVNIFYDLTGAKSNDAFDVNVYCSTNGKNGFGNIPLKSVSGEVGKGVTGGYGKKVTWNVLADVGSLKGNNIAFKVTAKSSSVSPSFIPKDLPLFEMVFVKGGTFSMGSGANSDEKPVHFVKVGDFMMGKYEVTQAEWMSVMGTNPSFFTGCDQCPVEQVSWNDVQQFIETLNTQTGMKFRLPTEAEWEYAAKGGKGTIGSEYAGNNSLNSVGWYDKNAGNKTHPVGQKQPNKLGLHDMSGNVYEWCSDWYLRNYYLTSPNSNPQGPSTGVRRVRRGGSWKTGAEYTRVADRSSVSPGLSNSYIGFRLVRSAN